MRHCSHFGSCEIRHCQAVKKCLGLGALIELRKRGHKPVPGELWEGCECLPSCESQLQFRLPAHPLCIYPMGLSPRLSTPPPDCPLTVNSRPIQMPKESIRNPKQAQHAGVNMLSGGIDDDAPIHLSLQSTLICPWDFQPSHN